MSYTFADVKEYSSTLKVLYVEDEDSIREQFYNIYLKLFGDALSAKNGEEGLRAFYEYKPDIVISDIRMPLMSGVDMAKAIKQTNPEVKIILTTAHSDSEFLMKAIEIGISRFILKPIDKELLTTALYETCKSVCDRQAAEKLKKIELQEQINKQASIVVSQIVSVTPNAIVALQKNKIVFANKAFYAIASEEFLIRLEKGDIEMEGLFNQITAYDDADGARDACAFKADIVGKNGRKIYQVCKAEITLGDDEKALFYALSDITRLEYQKMKLKQYGDHLEEFFYKRLAKERNKTSQILPKNEEAPQVVTIKPKITTNLGEINDKIAQSFGEHRLKVLRRSRQDSKMSAVEFMSEVGDGIEDAIHDLQDADVELGDFIERIAFPISKQNLQDAARAFTKYSDTMYQTVDFEDIAIAVKSLSEFLSELSVDDVDDKKFRTLLQFINNIKEDLRNWTTQNFIEQSSEDIHYLDASLMSSCLQLQMAFTPQASDDSDDLGLDLF